MHSDMKQQLLHHHEFLFDTIFSEATTNTIVYQQAAKPLIQIACQGGFATAMVYGQTGSGKTFTMTSIYTEAAKDIFKILHEETPRFAKPPIVSCSFIEIAGDTISDLLNGFHATQLRTAGDGMVHAFPLTEPIVSSAEELMAIIQHALNIRTTAATGVHDSSSRSHAILRIYIQRFDQQQNQEECNEGTLTLVDLAGSEHRIDSMYHGKERRKETSQINASLMALKECIRARASNVSMNQYQHVFRKSKLTLALKASFTLDHAYTIVIATISPASKDTEHSLNTLRHACIMHGQNDQNHVDRDETRFVTGGITTIEHIGDVNISAIARKNIAHKKVHGEIENIKTSNGNTIDNKVAREANQEKELTDKMKRKMRRLSEIRSFQTLDPSLQTLLKHHRDLLGREERQLARMYRGSNAGGNQLPIDVLLPKTSIGMKEEEGNDVDNDDEVVDEVQTFHSSKILSTGNGSGGSGNYGEIDSEKEDTNVTGYTQARKPSSSSSSHPSDNLYEDDFEQFQPSTTNNNNNNHNELSNKPAITMEQLYTCVYIVEDIVHPVALARQLDALCRLHGYKKVEIEKFFSSKHLPKVSSLNSSSAVGDENSLTRPSVGGRKPSMQSIRGTNGGGGMITTSGNSSTATSLTPRSGTQQSQQQQLSTQTRQSSRGRGGMSTQQQAANAISPPVTSFSRVESDNVSVGSNRSAPLSSRSAGGSNSANNGGVVQKTFSTAKLENERTPSSGSTSRSKSPYRRHIATNNQQLPNNSTTQRAATPTSARGQRARWSTDKKESLDTHSSESNESSTAAPAVKDEQLSYAMQQLQKEAEQRKARQEAAKTYRDEVYRKKVSKVVSKNPSTMMSIPDGPVAVKEKAEIERLQNQLDIDRQTPLENKMSEAVRYGIKKQIALLKAMVLKKERARQEGDANANGGGNSGGDIQLQNGNQVSNDNPMKAITTTTTEEGRSGPTTRSKASINPATVQQSAQVAEHGEQEGEYMFSALGRPISKTTTAKTTAQSNRLNSLSNNGFRHGSGDYDIMFDGEHHSHGSSSSSYRDDRPLHYDEPNPRGSINGSLIDYNDDLNVLPYANPTTRSNNSRGRY
eukprot:scaffold2028_cov181-Ochromonas_danica.AAC.15